MKIRSNFVSVTILVGIIVISVCCNVNPTNKNICKCEEEYFENDSTKGVRLEKCLISTSDSMYQFKYFFQESETLKESYFFNKNGKQGDCIKFRNCSDLYPEFLPCKFETKSFLNGKLHGPFMRWTSDSIKWDEITYKNGVKHGIAIFYDKDGFVSQKLMYNNGVTGRYSLFFDKNGNLTSLNEFNIEGKYIKKVSLEQFDKLKSTFSEENILLKSVE